MGDTAEYHEDTDCQVDDAAIEERQVSMRSG